MSTHTLVILMVSVVLIAVVVAAMIAQRDKD